MTVAAQRQRLDHTLDHTLLDGARASFLRGNEEATELTARLGLAAGYSLLEIYETLRSGLVDLPDEHEPHERALAKTDLDASLVRVAARLRPAATRPSDSEVLVVTMRKHGIAACIVHLLSHHGISAGCVESSAFVGYCRSHAANAGLLPRVRQVVFEGSQAARDDLDLCLRLSAEPALSGRRIRSALLVGPDVLIDPSRSVQLSEVSIVEDLHGVLAAVGVSADNPLTPRERDVLQQVATGATNGQAAKALGVSLATIKKYLERTYVKLNSRDRASAVAIALQRGWM
jgi:DNA-binding CsgD family transcriptional regulator